MKKWFVYIVSAVDGSLYTGITTDVLKRVLTHNQGKGAKALKGKLPVKVVFTEEHFDGTTARKREAEIKGWGREAKLKLIGNDLGA